MRRPVRKLRRPDSFAASFAAPSVQSAEFRLHYRGWLAVDREAALAAASSEPALGLGLVIPKKWCKPAVRRNLIKRAMRQVLREWDFPTGAQVQSPVLMLRLTCRLPADFRSAASPALRQYVRQQLQGLLRAWERRAVVLAPQALSATVGQDRPDSTE